MCYFSNTFNLESAGCLGDQSPAAQGSKENSRSWQTVTFLSEGVREKTPPNSFDSFLLYSPSVFPSRYFPGDFLFSFLMFFFSFYWHSFSFSVIILPLQFMYPANSLGNIEITMWSFCVFQVNDYN